MYIGSSILQKTEMMRQINQYWTRSLIEKVFDPTDCYVHISETSPQTTSQDN